jgi:hypothetical protein
MEWVITVLRQVEGITVPISEIRWSGPLPKNRIMFAKKHGGTQLEIQSLREYLDTHEEGYNA